MPASGSSAATYARFEPEPQESRQAREIAAAARDAHAAVRRLGAHEWAAVAERRRELAADAAGHRHGEHGDRAVLRLERKIDLGRRHEREAHCPARAA